MNPSGSPRRAFSLTRGLHSCAGSGLWPPQCSDLRSPSSSLLRRAFLCPRSASPCRLVRGLRFAVKFKSVACALMGAALLGSVSNALARETCTVFTPEEMTGGTYRNVDGCDVPRPRAGSCPPMPHATYRCSDGAQSFSRHAQGACSHHGRIQCTITARQSCCP
jgi:hypothetical protein